MKCLVGVVNNERKWIPVCTRVMWPEANGSVIVGRNMDFHQDLHTNLWKLPRGVDRNDRVEGKLKWTSKYGSVIAGVYDLSLIHI